MTWAAVATEQARIITMRANLLPPSIIRSGRRARAKIRRSWIALKLWKAFEPFTFRVHLESIGLRTSLKRELNKQTDTTNWLPCIGYERALFERTFSAGPQLISSLVF